MSDQDRSNAKGVRPIDRVRSDVDQLAAELEGVQQQLALLLLAVALLAAVIGGLIWLR